MAHSVLIGSIVFVLFFTEGLRAECVLQPNTNVLGTGAGGFGGVVSAEACCDLCSAHLGCIAMAWRVDFQQCIVYESFIGTASQVGYVTSTDIGAGDDPHIFGFQGQQFEVAGVSGGAYNILSHSTMQFNCRLTHYTTKFLGADSTWFTEFGFQLENTKIFINSQGLVQVNGTLLDVGKEIKFNDAVVSHLDSNGVTIANPTFTIRISINALGHEEWCSEGCPHLDFKILAWDQENQIWISGESMLPDGPRMMKESETVLSDKIGKTHGLFGQTVRRIEYPNKPHDLKYIEGTVEDYRLKGDDLWSNDFKFNQF